MPSANTRIAHIATKPSSLVTPLILESCTAMPRPRVPLFTERVSARPTIRVPSRSQPMPAATRLTKQAPKSAAERAAAVVERAKARSSRQPVIKTDADRRASLEESEKKTAALRERRLQLKLKEEELLRRLAIRQSARTVPAKPTVAAPEPKRKLAPISEQLPWYLLPPPPRAPRATKFREVNDSPIRFPSFAKPKDGPRGILRKDTGQLKRMEPKKVSFSHVEKRVVSKWIGIRQGVETASQLSYNGIKVVGTSLHVHPDPGRVIGSDLQGWASVGRPSDFEYQYFFGRNYSHRLRFNGYHLTCENPGCNRRDLWRFNGQHKVNWKLASAQANTPFI